MFLHKNLVKIVNNYQKPYREIYMIDGIADQVQPPQEIVQQLQHPSSGFQTDELPTSIPNLDVKETQEPHISSDDLVTQENPSIPNNRPKQYLICVDDFHVSILSRLMPGLLFVCVEGMPINDNPDYQILVNPTNKQTPSP